MARLQRISERRGATVPLTAVLLVPLLGMLAFAIDIGYISSTKAQLQEAADAAAVAAASKLATNFDASYQTESKKFAAEFALMHKGGDDQVRLNTTTDIEFGFWEPILREFQGPSSANPNIKLNAVKVRVHRDSSNQSGPLKLFFGAVLGTSATNVSAEAISYIPSPVLTSGSLGGVGGRFLVDNDTFDEGQPAIQELAAKLGKTPDELLKAKDEFAPYKAFSSDWFISIPPGTILELQTGQVGDEALLDIDINKNNPQLPQFPFLDQASFSKFLKFNETSNNDPVSLERRGYFANSDIDPLKGVGRFNQPSLYPGLVNLNVIHVSPVYKGDVSALDGTIKADSEQGPDLNGDGKPDGYTTNDVAQNGVNALGYRRGLVAFKITGYKIDPARNYPYLPNLIFEIVDPALIDLDAVPPGTSTATMTYGANGVKNVRLVR